MDEIRAPNGLGAVEEFRRFQRVAPTGPSLNSSVPGPYTLSGRLTPNERYLDRYAITEALVPIVQADPVEASGFTFRAIPSAHENFETDEFGEHIFVGYLIEMGGKTIYHSGDCCLYEGQLERLQRWSIDLAMLPINGRDPARGVAGNFSGEEAAWLGRQIGARLVIPCHYEMFEFNSVSPDGFVAAAEAIGCPYRVLRAGERLSL